MRVDPNGMEDNTVSQFIQDYGAERIRDDSEGRYTVVRLNGKIEWIYWDSENNRQAYGIESYNDNGSLKMDRQDFLNIFGVENYKMSLNYNISSEEAVVRTIVANGTVLAVIRNRKVVEMVAGALGVLGLSAGIGLIESGYYIQEEHYAVVDGWIQFTKVKVTPSGDTYVSNGRADPNDYQTPTRRQWENSLRPFGYQ